MDDKGIIGTGCYPVKQGAIYPGPVTLLNDIMRCIISIGELNSPPTLEDRYLVCLVKQDQPDELNKPDESDRPEKRHRRGLAQTGGPLDFMLAGIVVPHPD
jgi:hypothetical protein